MSWPSWLADRGGRLGDAGRRDGGRALGGTGSLSSGGAVGWSVAILAPLVAACASAWAVQSYEVFGHRPIEPKASWEQEAAWVRECTGRPIELTDIWWETADSIRQGDMYYDGLYIWQLFGPNTKTIILVDTDRQTVRHELLHAAGGLNHDDEEFLQCLVR